MRNEKGFTLIELLVVILIIGILLALVIPNFVLFTERARRASVKDCMHVVQTSLEAYATDHSGAYPVVAGLVMEGEQEALLYYFPGGDIYNPPEEGTFGRPIVNPYTGMRYNDENAGFGDLMYAEQVYDGTGFAAQVAGTDEYCPYLDWAGYNEDYSGYITIGVWPEGDISELPPQEYGIGGWGRNTEEDDYPMYEFAANAEDLSTDWWIFYILHN